MSLHHAIGWSIRIAWFAFLAYWFIKAVGVKPVVKRQSPAGRIFQILIGIIAGVLLFDGGVNWRWLATRFISSSPAWLVTGAVITWAGIAIAIWARTILGGNWSALATVKQDHTLVRSGPYSVVRHPIYSGLLLAGLGTAVAIGEVRGLFAVAIAFVMWLIKLRTEERLMIEQFGDGYVEYRKRTWALVPFVL